MMQRASLSDRRALLGAVFAGQGASEQVASVFSPLSARLAEEAGFRVGFMGGSALAADHLATTDMGQITVDDIAGITRRIVAASDLALIVDGDDGHGGPVRTGWTVQRLEAAGAAAVTIEDSLLPAPGGKAGPGGPAVLPAAEFAARLGAAIAARQDPATSIIAQIVALPRGERADFITRLHIARDAGAAALMIFGLKTEEDLALVAREAGLPLFLAPIAPALNRADLATPHGIRAVFHGHQPLRAAMAALHEAYARTHRDGNGADAARLAIDPPLQDKALRRAEVAAHLARLSPGSKD